MTRWISAVLALMSALGWIEFATAQDSQKRVAFASHENKKALVFYSKLIDLQCSPKFVNNWFPHWKSAGIEGFIVTVPHFYKNKLISSKTYQVGVPFKDLISIQQKHNSQDWKLREIKFQFGNEIKQVTGYISPSQVFQGTWKGKPVAIENLMELTYDKAPLPWSKKEMEVLAKRLNTNKAVLALSDGREVYVRDLKRIGDSLSSDGFFFSGKTQYHFAADIYLKQKEKRQKIPFPKIKSITFEKNKDVLISLRDGQTMKGTLPTHADQPTGELGTNILGFTGISNSGEAFFYGPRIDYPDGPKTDANCVAWVEFYP